MTELLIKTLAAEVNTDALLLEYFETLLKLAHERQSLHYKALEKYPNNTLLKHDYELATRSCLILTAVLQVIEEHVREAADGAE